MVRTLLLLTSLAVLSSSWILTGCEHQDSGADAGAMDQNASNHPVIPDPDFAVTNPSPALKLMLAGRVGCATPQDCLSGVGLVMVASPDQKSISQCSGFLLAPDTVMTAAHCLPPDLRSATESCGGRIRFAFSPDTAGTPARNVGCDQVISVSTAADPDNVLNPDYAFLKLRNPVYRSYFHLSHDGIVAQNPAYGLTHVDASGSVPIVKTTQCSAVMNSILVLASGHPSSPVLPFACPATPEASGGMLVGSDLSAHGMWYGAVSPSVIQAVREVFSARGAAPQAFWGGNLACIQTPVDPAEFYFSDECSLQISVSGLGDQVKKVKDQWVSQYAAEVRQKLNDWATSNERIFGQWQVVSMNNELFAAPLCFTPSTLSGGSAWLNDYRHVIFYDSSAKQKFQLPMWSVDLSLDPSYMIQGRVASEGTSAGEVDFSPSHYASLSSSDVTVKVKSVETGTQLSVLLEAIGTCF